MSSFKSRENIQKKSMGQTAPIKLLAIMVSRNVVFICYIHPIFSMSISAPAEKRRDFLERNPHLRGKLPPLTAKNGKVFLTNISVLVTIAKYLTQLDKMTVLAQLIR